MKKILFTLSIVLIFQLGGLAQFKQVTIPGSEVRKINSAIVNQEYELHILLPAKYATSNKKYPVVYLMDSQWDFPLVKSLYGQQYYDGFIPELIVVGITWGGINPNPDSLRARDYTPTNEARQPQSGGADKFLSFIRTELFPFIENNYKADATNRTIMGCSLGGLITLYTLFTQPDLFNGYVAASPAYGWGGEALYQYEKKFFEKQPASPKRVFITMGGVERGLPGFEKLADLLAARKYSSVQIKSRVLENTGHSGTKAEGFGRGLQYVFDKPRLDIAPAVLSKYTGNYKSASGTIEVKTENNQLAIYLSPTYKFVLFAASDKEFYSRSEFFNISFKLTNDRVDELQVDYFGGTQFFKKVE